MIFLVSFCSCRKEPNPQKSEDSFVEKFCVPSKMKSEKLTEAILEIAYEKGDVL